ncbi:ScyD/ScyE family protein [Dyadobacter aurulentus]|uniref:ScyD/ScyE family protein n=1 Tax=Dyadobacter sp. UC 10 TaxID=2605428 RepID=UPI0011F1EEBD|nr:ScyD/ScyE family protein [Dyadobacter sp. UC 10]KAA0993823.1 ScyD/ScyE family protein [Dyadobacter sp. UC 10]
MRTKFLKPLAAFLLFASAVVSCTDHEVPIPEPTQFAVSNVVAGLRAPIGMDKDNRGNLWVSEIGTGKNDGAIVMISPNGTKTTFVSGFTSIGSDEAGVEGISHVMFHDAKLYILHGIDGKLFITDVSGFNAGDPERKMSDLIVHEYGQEIRKIKPTKDNNSNLYAMTVGPDGNMYMVDAGANAVIKRDNNTGDISVFAPLPEVGTGPIVDAVPTGIVFDGNKFLISTLSGGPFVKNSAKIFAVDMKGEVSVHAENFTTLTSIALTANNKPLVIKFADFDKGFKPFTGAVLNEQGKELLGGIMMPTDIKRTGEREFYLLSMPLGTVQKLTY